MKRKKVIEYIGSLGDGGAETLVKDYVRLIDREKFDTVIVATRDFGPSANSRIIKELGIRIIYIYPRWNFFIKILNKLLGLWYVPFQLRKIIRQEKADVLHVHLALLKYVRRIGRVLKNVRVFYTCHSVADMVFGADNVCETNAARYLLKHNEMQLIALHIDMAKELNRIFNINNTIVVRNGIDIESFINPGVTKKEERNALGIPQEAYVVGHIGRFDRMKNQAFLVEVFHEIAKNLPTAFLVMVGAGDTSSIQKKLKEYGYEDRYMILSHRSDVNKILQTMDVFVFPSIREGLGIALIEAQAAGLKCVVSDTIPDDAIRTNQVHTLPVGDARLWADTILNKVLNLGLENSLSEYDMNNVIKRLEKLYSGEY